MSQRPRASRGSRPCAHRASAGSRREKSHSSPGCRKELRTPGCGVAAADPSARSPARLPPLGSDVTPFPRKRSNGWEELRKFAARSSTGADRFAVEPENDPTENRLSFVFIHRHRHQLAGWEASLAPPRATLRGEGLRIACSAGGRRKPSAGTLAPPAEAGCRRFGLHWRRAASNRSAKEATLLKPVEPPFYPIIYLRGYAMTMSEIEDMVADPCRGFNLGSTKIRQRRSRPLDLPAGRGCRGDGERDGRPPVQAGDVVRRRHPWIRGLPGAALGGTRRRRRDVRADHPRAVPANGLDDLPAAFLSSFRPEIFDGLLGMLSHVAGRRA